MYWMGHRSLTSSLIIPRMINQAVRFVCLNTFTVLLINIALSIMGLRS